MSGFVIKERVSKRRYTADDDADMSALVSPYMIRVPAVRNAIAAAVAASPADSPGESAIAIIKHSGLRAMSGNVVWGVQRLSCAGSCWFAHLPRMSQSLCDCTSTDPASGTREVGED
jgi:hypothetical protein